MGPRWTGQSGSEGLNGGGVLVGGGGLGGGGGGDWGPCLRRNTKEVCAGWKGSNGGAWWRLGGRVTVVVVEVEARWRLGGHLSGDRLSG